MPKRSERPSTADCEHDFKPEPGMPRAFRCVKCRCAGYTRKTAAASIKTAKSRAAAQERAKTDAVKAMIARDKVVTTYPCRSMAGKARNESSCGRPAYTANGRCDLHAELKVGETDD
jgi:hypothetical protein